MIENPNRLRHGWHPRKDAHWVWWVIADTMVAVSIIKMWIARKFRAKGL